MTIEEFVSNLDRASLAETGFSKRRQTEDDFFAICRKENITVQFKDLATSFYFAYLGRKFIVIPEHFIGLQREFAMFHELGHYFLGHQYNELLRHHQGSEQEAREQEANAFADIALMPLKASR